MLPARRLFSCEYTGIPVGNFSSKRFALWYDKSHKSGLSEMRVSQNNRKGKNAEQMLHDANDLKSYQMIWLGQRIFVMTTTNFAHLMKKESKN